MSITCISQNWGAISVIKYKHKGFILLLLCFLFSLYVIPIHASTENGTLMHIDNRRKVTYPNELVQFDVNITNDRSSKENFIIRHARENSVLELPLDIAMSDDNQKVYDSSPFGNHGMLYNFGFNESSWGIRSENLLEGSALSFDGVDDYINLLTNDSLNPSSITLEAWVRPKARGDLFILDKYSADKGYCLYIQGGTNYIRFGVGNGISWTDISSGVIPDLDTWVHIVATKDETLTENAVKLYVNGVLKNQGNLSGAVSASPSDLKVGCGVDTTRFFNGIISEVRVYDRALTDEEIAWLYNRSWRENLSSYKVELGPGENTQVTFSVKVPEGARAGHVQKFLLSAFPLSNLKCIETKTVTVEVLEHHDVVVSLDENEKSGKPRDIINFDAVVRNLGNVEDTYDISIEDDGGWDISFSPESIAIPPGETGTGTVTISVAVPSEAYPGDSTSFRIQAASRGDSSLVGQVEGTAVATPIFDLDITAHSELRQGSPGSEVTLSLELRNLGTAPDTFDLEIENAMGWDVEVDPGSISLENGETGKVVVKVGVPEDALIGQMKRMTIQAVSREDPGVSAESSISVEVVPPFWERPDIRFLVGLIIGALMGVTLTGSIIFRIAPVIRRSRKS